MPMMPATVPYKRRPRYQKHTGQYSAVTTISMTPAQRYELCRIADNECDGNVSELVRRWVTEKAANGN